MTYVRRYWPLALLVAVVAFVLFARGLALDHWLRGFEDAEKAADVRHYQEKAARLGKALGVLQERARISAELAANRPKVSVNLPVNKTPPGEQNTPGLKPAVSGAISPPDPQPVVIATVPDTINRATVTINDTSYAVPVRVAEVVRDFQAEAMAADKLREAIPPVVTAATETIAAADTAIAEKKRGFFRRLLSGSVTVVCYTGGAAVGAAGGAAIGAVVGNIGGAAAGGAAGAIAGLGLCRAIR